jgi:hypothetical protein
MTAPLIPLNTFRLVLTPLISGSTEIYQSPTNVSAIMLSAHIANTTLTPYQVTVKLRKNTTVVNMVKNATIPPQEALNPFTGRVVLEEGNGFIIETTAPSGSLEVSLSVLENANT